MRKRTVEHPSVTLEHFYICEECGREYRRANEAKSCEDKHRWSCCLHNETHLSVDPDGKSIDRYCVFCGFFGFESIDFSGLPDDQEVLREVVAVIERAKAKADVGGDPS